MGTRISDSLVGSSPQNAGADLIAVAGDPMRDVKVLEAEAR